MKNLNITYLFDPLCGWCYGAAPAIRALAASDGLTVIPTPTGLFSHTGRLMDAAFARHAWSNDQRIAQMTGQAFSEAYRVQILGDHTQPFDSAAIVNAMTAVKLSAPEQELAALAAIQHARYVDAKIITDNAVLADILNSLGLHEAAENLNNEAVIRAAEQRIAEGRALAHQFGIQGVPSLVVQAADGSLPAKLIGSSMLFESGDHLAAKVHQAYQAA